MPTAQQVAAKLAQLLAKANPDIRLDAASVQIRQAGKVRKINIEPNQGSDRGVQFR